jgi:hypothetical protein
MKFFRRVLNTIFPTLGLKNSPTVRYAFSFLFVFAAIASIAAVSSTKGSYIKVVSSENAVEVDTQFKLDVYVFADAPINAVDISVLYPESQVEVLGIDKGESVITLWTEEPFVKDGAVVLRGGTYKRGFVGEHKIATINLKAKTTGSAQFVAGTVNLLAGDGKGTSVKADTSRAKFVTTVFPVGEKPANTTTLEGSVGFVVVTDIDGDGAVSLRDISSFMANWASKEQKFDFNNDGQMTFRDFSIILFDYFAK